MSQHVRASTSGPSLETQIGTEKEMKKHGTMADAEASNAVATAAQTNGASANTDGAASRRSLRGNRIDYNKLCASKTFTGYQCHQCKT